MNDRIEYIKSGLLSFPEYKSAVFDCGYLITNKDIELTDNFPFYGFWHACDLDNSIHIYYHERANLFTLKTNNAEYILLGHAYNPFDGKYDERDILNELEKKCAGDFEKAKEYIDDLTGLFFLCIVKNGILSFCGDFEAMRATYYCRNNDEWFIGSHEELIHLYTPLTWDSYVDKLEAYRWYYLYGEGLPGDITHYKEMKKLIGNTYIVFSQNEFKIFRLWPRRPINMVKNETEYTEVVKQIANIMSISMDLIAKKWDKPAVSTTGGRDSQGSLAAAVHIKERYQFFSYNSQPVEKVDCDAAERLCASAGVKHTTYEIPLDKTLFPEYDIVKAILSFNGNRRKLNHNDIMKRIYFRKNSDFDVEVKSWTSEIGRCFYYKKYGVKRLQKRCNARRTNVMNNIYLFNPVLMYKTDAKYRDYLKRTEYNEHMFNYDWTDLIELEMRDGQWGTSVISVEHMFAYDVTIPYNNRHLGDLFLAVQFEDRLNDRTHIDFTGLLCPEITKQKIIVRDAAHDRKRMLLDRYYYFISSIRPL